MTVRGAVRFNETDTLLMDTGIDDETEGVGLVTFQSGGSKYLVYAPMSPVLLVTAEETDGTHRVMFDEEMDDATLEENLRAVEEELPTRAANSSRTWVSIFSRRMRTKDAAEDAAAGAGGEADAGDAEDAEEAEEAAGAARSESRARADAAREAICDVRYERLVTTRRRRRRRPPAARDAI